MTKSQELQDVLNTVYAGAVKECEELEQRLAAAGGIRIHGHHMAQRIVADVEKRLIDRGLFPASPSAEPPSAA